MNQDDLIKKYLDVRFRDVHPTAGDVSLRGFVSNSNGEKKLRLGIMDDMPGVNIAIVLVSRRDVLALQDMFGLTYQKSETALGKYIINRLNYDATGKEINIVPIDL